MLWLRRRRLFSRSLHHFVEDSLKLIQAGCRDDNIVTATVHIFRDAQKPPARIFLEREQECLPLDLNLVALNGVFLNLWPGLLTISSTPSEWRWSFVRNHNAR